MLTRAANSIEFYWSLTYFSKFKFYNLIIYEFKFEFDKNTGKLFVVQADEYPKSRQLFRRRCSCYKKMKIFCSCSAVGSRLNLNCLVTSKLSVLWSQLNNKLYSIFRSDIFFSFKQIKYLSNKLEQFYSSSGKIFFRVQV